MNFYQQLGFLVFGSRLRRLSETFLSDVNSVYKANKIPFDASWFPVFYILSKEGEVSIRQISNQLGITHSAASQMVSNLQEKGYIKSTVSKKDARHKAVAFTPKGEKLLQKILPVWQALHVAMQELGGGPSESQEILTALTQVEERMSEKSLFKRIEDHL
ncbi:MAG TPA: MarR family winged helix-turn-helix transcriptional regulator [Chitinophagaceae bacterium]|nr:MarR family winged helix-turn-helix transcriptional regulator [Chitinophagaceae bacterium]